MGRGTFHWKLGISSLECLVILLIEPFELFPRKIRNSAHRNIDLFSQSLASLRCSLFIYDDLLWYSFILCSLCFCSLLYIYFSHVYYFSPHCISLYERVYPVNSDKYKTGNTALRRIRWWYLRYRFQRWIGLFFNYCARCSDSLTQWQPAFDGEGLLQSDAKFLYTGDTYNLRSLYFY